MQGLAGTQIRWSHWHSLVLGHLKGVRREEGGEEGREWEGRGGEGRGGGGEGRDGEGRGVRPLNEGLVPAIPRVKYVHVRYTTILHVVVIADNLRSFNRST